MKKILTTFALLTVLAGCSKQKFYEVPTMPGTDEPIENPTRLTVNTDTEASLTSGLTVYLLSEDGNQLKATFSPNTAVDVEAGKYLILKVNTPFENATLTGTKLKLATASTRGTEGTVDSAPDVHAAHALVTLKANEEHTYTLKPEAYTRLVKFNLELQGITADALASVSYSLTNVNNVSDLSKYFCADCGSGNCTLTGLFPTPSTQSDGTLTTQAEARLLGLDYSGEPQLTVTATLTDGSTQSLTESVGKLLQGFYTQAEDEPVGLNILLSFGLDDVSGSISGWEDGWNEDVQGW
ncbi:MAG: FimB/Mfa2 family fimbrial subunit [Bacteroides sp.]|nr:FimB/Mfa2 family fimbrial subunit [Bacteroides sp.]